MKTIDQICKELEAPFPPDTVSWRLGKVNGNKGLALAYIDSRDVQDRLDEIVGRFNWQTEHHAATDGKVTCRLGIRNPEKPEEFIWKSDGAGATDFEGDKGSYSDSTKRAAVMWGVGRYLYGIKAGWITVDISDPKRPQIPGHELERLMALLPGYSGGVTVSPLSGQAKTPGKFWDNKNFNIISRLPKALQTAHGDADWNNPDTIVWLCEAMPNFIDKAPNRVALTKLHEDNLAWIVSNTPEPDRDVIMTAFKIRAGQFDLQQGGKK